MRKTASRLGPLAATSGLVLALAACSGGDSPPSAPTGSRAASAGATAAAATPGGATGAPSPGAEATAYPVPARATPAPLPDLGTAQGLGYTVTLNTLRRSGPRSGLLSATVTSKDGGSFDDFTEPGYGTIYDPLTKKPIGGAYDFSAVTLAVKGDPTIYQVLRDEQQRCACSTGLLSVPKAEPFGVYAYVTLPEDADIVTVAVKGLAPFMDVKVTP